MAAIKAFLVGLSSSTPVEIQIEDLQEINLVEGPAVTVVQTTEAAPHQCVVCGKVHSNASNLNRHMRNIHKTEPLQPPTKHPKCQCPLCGDQCLQRSSLIKHLKDEHDVHCMTEEHLFQDYQTFLDWKKNVEIKTKTDFVARTHKRDVGKKDYKYYKCSRSGYCENKGTNKRTPKESRKIGGHCPAMIRASTTSEGLIQVEYTRTHVGHKLEEKFLKIPDDVREYVIEKLKEGTPTWQILASFKVSFPNIPRAHLLTRKAITNIASSVGIKMVKGSRRDTQSESKKKRTRRTTKNKTATA